MKARHPAPLNALRADKLYGGGAEPVSMALDSHDFEMLIHHSRGGEHAVLKMEFADAPQLNTAVLVKAVQHHPLRGQMIHVDFLRVTSDSLITVNVPVRFENEQASPGLKRGGVLNVVRHEVELKCPAGSVPHDVVVDVTGFDVGDSIHISVVKLPKGVTTVIDRDFTIATIVAPSGLKSQEDAAEGEAAA